VEKANEVLAVETLLVSDELFRYNNVKKSTTKGTCICTICLFRFKLSPYFYRANDVAVRKKYVNLVESIKENGGDVK
jgi:stalled ribosome rescue protein Dom34